MQISVLGYILILVLGLVFGSFFNVAIHRWPKEDRKEREWVKTPSHCPKCGGAIKWFDNIPLLSYILLRGRCRHCQAPISIRYPLVELGTALLWVLTAWLTATYGLTGIYAGHQTSLHIVFAIVLASLYLLTIIIDFETSLIPDEITIAHFITAWLFLWLCGPQTISHGWLPSLIGMLALSALFFGFALLGWMGIGDVGLALGLGVLFGWPLIVEVGFLSVLLGGVVAIGVMVVLMLAKKYKRGIPIPFGPYLALAAYISLFWGKEIARWYLGLFLPASRMPASLLGPPGSS